MEIYITRKVIEQSNLLPDEKRHLIKHWTGYRSIKDEPEWQDIDIKGKIFDCHIDKDEDGFITATLYPTVKVAKHLRETNTSRWVTFKVKHEI